MRVDTTRNTRHSGNPPYGGATRIGTPVVIQADSGQAGMTNVGAFK
ncbi:MAG: hypothetical protein H8E87_08170 [FCB group bacterium]|nr:hypothetical protein [FCB group bacterium]